MGAGLLGGRAAGEVATAVAHGEGLPGSTRLRWSRRGGRLVCYETCPPGAADDEAVGLKPGHGLDHGGTGHAETAGKLAHGGQLLPRLVLPGRDPLGDHAVDALAGQFMVAWHTFMITDR
jgi:hypothetical protein